MSAWTNSWAQSWNTEKLKCPGTHLIWLNHDGGRHYSLLFLYVVVGPCRMYVCLSDAVTLCIVLLTMYHLYIYLKKVISQDHTVYIITNDINCSRSNKCISCRNVQNCCSNDPLWSANQLLSWHRRIGKKIPTLGVTSSKESLLTVFKLKLLCGLERVKFASPPRKHEKDKLKFI